MANIPTPLSDYPDLHCPDSHYPDSQQLELQHSYSDYPLPDCQHSNPSDSQQADPSDSLHTDHTDSLHTDHTDSLYTDLHFTYSDYPCEIQ
jgi:hypothetical protein